MQPEDKLLLSETKERGRETKKERQRETKKERETADRDAQRERPEEKQGETALNWAPKWEKSDNLLPPFPP